MSSETAETTTREMESHYPRTPIGHSIRDYGQLQTITELSSQSGTSQKQDQARKIYWQAITANDFTYRTIDLFGQIRFTLLGAEGRNSKQHEGKPNERRGPSLWIRK